MSSCKILTLMNKNKPVCDISYNSVGHFCAKITNIWDLKYAPPALLGTDGMITEDTFNAWWRRRAVPVTRTGIERLLHDAEITDTRALLDANHGLSLSDRYWLNDGNHSWEEINYFDNPFSDDLGMLTLQPEGLEPICDSVLSMLNPSSSLGGNMKKKWGIAEDGTRLLYKKSNSSNGLDVYGEEIAAALFAQVFPRDAFVPYKTVQEGNNLYAVCPNMLHDDEELVPVFDLLTNNPHYRNTFPELVSLLNGLEVPGVETFLANMFACDFLIANKDRHYNNFGAIRNVETLEYVRMAPIFDSGDALWHLNLAVNPEKSQDYYAKPFGSAAGVPALDMLKDLPRPDLLLAADLGPFYEKAKRILQESPYITDSRMEDTMRAIRHQETVLRGFVWEKAKGQENIPEGKEPER